MPDPALAVLGANLPGIIPDIGMTSAPPPTLLDRQSINMAAEAAEGTQPAAVGVRSGSSNNVPAQLAPAETARHGFGGANEASAAMPTTQTSDASWSRSSLNPTVSSRSRDNLHSELPPASLGSSPPIEPIERIVVDPQILRAGTSRDPDGITRDPSVHAAAAPSAVEQSFPSEGAAAGSSSVPVANATPAELSEQLVRHVLGSIEKGTHEVVLRLHPSELGDLTIRLAVTGRDVSAWFATPQIQVQQAIGDALAQLHSNLGNAGYTLTGAWVGDDASNQQDRREQPPLPSAPRHAVDSAFLELPSAMPISSSNFGVSVYV